MSETDRPRLPGYAEHPFRGAQACLLDAAWQHLAGDAPRPHRLPPFWQPSLGVRRTVGPDGAVSDVCLTLFGPAGRARLYAPAPGAEMIAIRVQPEIAAALLKQHPREHVDAKTPLGALPGFDAVRRLAETGAPGPVLAGALASVLGRAGAEIAQPRDRVSHAARLIRASRGRVRIERLAGHLDLPERTLRRHFTDRLGLSPKAYAGLVRLNALIQAADRQLRPDWAGLALRFGFADQAHMSGEVARQTGLSPARLHAERIGLAEISKTGAPALS